MDAAHCRRAVILPQLRIALSISQGQIQKVRTDLSGI
jgi:hypothetical protein